MDPHLAARAIQSPGIQPRHDLASFDDTPAGQHLARLTADVELLLELQLHGFEGLPWQRFAEVLAAYGYQVMTAWIFTGQIYTKLRERKLGGSDMIAPRRPLSHAQAEELAGLVLGEAIPKFRDQVLRRHRWDAAKGATLKTFFIGQCLLRFPTLYRRWRREEFDDQALATGTIAERAAVEDPAGTVAARDLIHRESSRLPRTTAAVVTLESMGFAQAEIAELLQITEGAVESRLYRHRRTLEQ